jgi:hypothetical protein
MKKSTSCIAALVAGLFFFPLTIEAQDPSPSKALVVGTFDSRVLATAYYRSAQFEKKMTETKKQRDDANAAGDKETADEITAHMPELQKQMHGQVFGNAPVDDILELIKDQLPKIAASANVDVIVSKWHVVYCPDTSSFVDVSFLLSEKFQPDEQTLEVMNQVFRDPVVLSPEEVDEHSH